MSTSTSSLSIRTTSPSTMSPSLKSMRTLSSTGTTSPFSSRKKSFMVNSRDDFCVVSVMKQLLSFTLLDGCRLYSNYGAVSGQPSAVSQKQKADGLGLKAEGYKGLTCPQRSPTLASTSSG